MRSGLDLRTDPLDDVLATASTLLDTRLVRDGLVYGGEDGATCGTRTQRGTWVRFQQHPREHPAPPGWDAEETAAELTGVRKPWWHQTRSWLDTARGVLWRVDEMDLITSPVLGGLTGFTTEPELPDSWWAHLRASLSALAEHPTRRQALDQDTVTRLISRVFGPEVDTTITEWSTAHGDLHWGNLTADGTLLDWEGWGLAPRGLDAAQLWGMALPWPAIAERIQHEFTAELDSRSGQLVQLMWCATVLHAADRRTDLTHYRAPAHTAATRLLATLEQRPTAAGTTGTS